MRINGQHDFGRPARNRTARYQDRVSHGFIPGTTSVEHTGQHRYIQIRIVIHTDFRLAFVQAVQTTDVLRDGAAPGYRQRQKQRIQPRVVETFADVAPRGQQHARLAFRNARELLGRRVQFLGSSAAVQRDHILHMRCQSIGQGLQVLLAFRQEQRGTAIPQSLQNVIADHPIAILIRDQFLIERVKLQSPIGVRLNQWTKGSGTNVDGMGEWSLLRGRLRVDSISHGPTLHEDDRVMSVFSSRRSPTAPTHTSPAPAASRAQSCAPTDDGTRRR